MTGGKTKWQLYALPLGSIKTMLKWKQFTHRSNCNPKLQTLVKQIPDLTVSLRLCQLCKSGKVQMHPSSWQVTAPLHLLESQYTLKHTCNSIFFSFQSTIWYHILYKKLPVQTSWEIHTGIVISKSLTVILTIKRKFRWNGIYVNINIVCLVSQYQRSK